MGWPADPALWQVYLEKSRALTASRVRETGRRDDQLILQTVYCRLTPLS